MKTPRDILLQRHSDSEPKLDAIRSAVVAEMRDEQTKQPTPGLISTLLWFPGILWRELILPSRRVWVGFALTWLMIVAVNIANFDRPTAAQAKIKPMTINLMLAWQQQQKLLAELNTEPSDGDKPKPIAPKPRSDLKSLLPIG